MQTVAAIHNILRWAVLLFGVLTLINALSGTLKKRVFTESDNKSNLLFMISCDIQLLLGLILLFGNSWMSRMSNLKTDVSVRFFVMEHGFMMILAWILVHVGRVAVKKAGTDAAKHKRMLIYFGLALLLILVSIPWPFRQPGISRQLLPGF
ncbi:MAG TPA: hypothetical protein PLY34_17865 [Ferruginibacter sp.]|nr:hypothetical protein [Ferruginibacter sp.]HPH91453.1 hypothetical protein [Ferruginibacter sp.]